MASFSPRSTPLSSCLFLLLLLLSFGASGVSGAYGWNECVVSPQDEWRPATERIPALRMRAEFDRRYTCNNERASFLAASYFFDSPCMGEGFFYPTDLYSCLRGRRLIFLGDSLTNQQGDSLLGMLGWHADWMRAGDPRNNKIAVAKSGKWLGAGGKKYNTLTDCWHPATGRVEHVERCWDFYSRNFPPLPAADSRVAQHRRGEVASLIEVGGQGQGQGHGRTDGGGGEDEDEFSVHTRMFSYPTGPDWLAKALLDFNETRASDVFVVNFGGHYHYPPGNNEDEKFKAQVFPVLDALAELGEKATVVWREIAPTHFPAENATYDAFESLGYKFRKTFPCCTGTPPRVLDRNVWVENYLRDNGLTDRVKLLRIYDMTWTRGAAHHTCHAAPPSTMDQSKSESSYCPVKGMADCVHFSEPGVVEEWNRLLLSHICGGGG